MLLCVIERWLMGFVGMFRLFKPDECINGGSPGRKYVAEVAKREGL